MVTNREEVIDMTMIIDTILEGKDEVAYES